MTCAEVFTLTTDSKIALAWLAFWLTAGATAMVADYVQKSRDERRVAKNIRGVG